MQGLINRFKRFILKQRIEMLRADIAMAVDRRYYAQLTIESADKFYADAHQRLRRLRGQLSLLERPETLVEEALRNGK
jgi:hypothetical protein